LPRYICLHRAHNAILGFPVKLARFFVNKILAGVAEDSHAQVLLTLMPQTRLTPPFLSTIVFPEDWFVQTDPGGLPPETPGRRFVIGLQ
jgi:hypothetical protein